MEITFKGRGGHGSAPDKTIDPIAIAAHFINDVQTVVSREKDPMEFGVVTVGAIQGGTVGNIIPDSVTLRGTIRSYKPDVRTKLLEGVRRTANAAAAMAGAPAPDVTLTEGGAAVINNADVVARTEVALKAGLGAANVVRVPPITASEDFSDYLNQGVPGMGFFPQLMGGDPELLATPQGRKWYDEIRGGQGATAAIDIIVSFSNGKLPKGFPVPGTAAYKNAWQQTIKAAEAYNEPGRFTAFIGYEWTSNTGGNNLHRNVIFRGNGTQAGLVEPYTTQAPLGSDNPVDLWKWMAAAEQKTGSELLAIAHNGNLSNGRMAVTIEAAIGKAALRKAIDWAYSPLAGLMRSHLEWLKTPPNWMHQSPGSHHSA